MPSLTHRRAPGLCRVGCVRDSKETAAQSSLFFSGQGKESERSGITLPDTRGWSTQSDKWEWGHTVLWVRNSLREASRRAKQCDLTAPLSPKHKVRHMHHKRAFTPPWFHSLTHSLTQSALWNKVQHQARREFTHTRVRSCLRFCCGSTQAAPQGCFFPLRPSSFRGHRYGCFHDGAAASFFSGDTWADSTEGFVVGHLDRTAWLRL